MRKDVWILNHYATEMGINKGGRHFWIAKYLKKNGYNPVIFCSSFPHKGEKNYIDDNKKFSVETFEDIPFVYIKTNEYQDNGKQRIKNMFQYFWRLLRNYKKIANVIGKPDVIIGSSVHPLACLAAIIIGKKYKIKKIVEIRDLWPENLVSMKYLKENSFFTKLLYCGEKYLYKKADEIIFLMEGGKRYILDRGWQNDINLDKIHYINNGVDLEKFEDLSNKIIYDEDLLNSKFKIIYTGSVSTANNIKNIVDLAEKTVADDDIIYLIYGDGNELGVLKEYAREKNIKNLKFKGYVNKEQIPAIICKADILVINVSEKMIEADRYGISYNKMFEYLASGKYILQLQNIPNSILGENECGYIIKNEDPKDIIYMIKNLSKEEYEENSRKQKNIAKNYDFKDLTDKVIRILEK